MRKARFTEEQMVAIIREVDREPVLAVAKRHGISEQTIYTWHRSIFMSEVDLDQLPLPAPLRTLSSWSRTQKNTQRRAAEDSVNSQTGKPDNEALHKTCIPCHRPAKGAEAFGQRTRPKETKR